MMLFPSFSRGQSVRVLLSTGAVVAALAGSVPAEAGSRAWISRAEATSLKALFHGYGLLAARARVCDETERARRIITLWQERRDGLAGDRTGMRKTSFLEHFDAEFWDGYHALANESCGAMAGVETQAADLVWDNLYLADQLAPAASLHDEDVLP